MSVKITDNSERIKSENDNKTSLGIRFIVQAVHRTANPRTPKKEGNLRADVIEAVVGKHGKITWTKDYAVWQENKQFKNYTTPGTGPHFAEQSVAKVVEDSPKYFRQAGIGK